MDLWPILPFGHRTAFLGEPRRFLRKSGKLEPKTSLFVGAALALQALVLGIPILLPSLEDTGRPNEAEFGTLTVAATVSKVPNLSTAARVDIVSRGMTAASVYYGSTTDYGFRTPWIDLPPSGSASTTIIGLHPNSFVHFSVSARSADGRVVSSGDTTVKTGYLPNEVARTYRPTATGTPTLNYLLVGLTFKGLRSGAALMLDREGSVLWYRKTTRRVRAFDRLANGRFILQGDAPGVFDEISLEGALVRQWVDPQSTVEALGDEFLQAPGGRFFIIGQEVHTVDSRRAFSKGIRFAMRFDQVALELTQHGDVTWRWSTYQNLSESELVIDPTEEMDPKDYQVANMNSVDVTPDGNVLASFRDTNSIAKIDRKEAQIAWRLGGTKSDFTFVDDPLGGFSRQCDVRILQNGNVLLFDGGATHSPPQSRAVEYEIDETARTAKLVWEYRPNPPRFSPSGGSARRLPSGNTVVAFGWDGTIEEVSPKSRVVWELHLPGAVFRAVPLHSLYP